jgi:hypothetical protein
MHYFSRSPDASTGSLRDEHENLGQEPNTLSTMRHNCVARRSCCLFPIRGSITKCSRISVERS